MAGVFDQAGLHFGWKN
jgi:hypothetical protein